MIVWEGVAGVRTSQISKPPLFSALMEMQVANVL
jgi:hypothetical protein